MLSKLRIDKEMLVFSIRKFFILPFSVKGVTESLYNKVYITVVQSEPCQRSKMELFKKIKFN